MPCPHGIVFYWDCPDCEEDKRVNIHNAKFDAEQRRLSLEREKLSELQKIRKLLEQKEAV